MFHRICVEGKKRLDSGQESLGAAATAAPEESNIFIWQFGVLGIFFFVQFEQIHFGIQINTF